MIFLTPYKMYRRFKKKASHCFLRWMMRDDFDVVPKWLVKHAANCPRCAKLLSGYNRVSISLQLMKTSPHKRDLLNRANCQALEYMSFKLRTTEQAHELRNVVITPSKWAKLGGAWQAAAKAVACMLVVLMVKMSVFSILFKIQDTGQKFADRYYERYAEYLDEPTDDSV